MPFDFVRLVNDENERAKQMHKPLFGHDESLSVLEEEVDEVRREVYKSPRTRQPAELLDELVQVGAMAMRWAESTKLCGEQSDYTVARFGDMVASELARERCRRANVNSHHDALTRLHRAMRGPQKIVLDDRCRGQAGDLLAGLVSVGVACQRWAEDLLAAGSDKGATETEPGNGQEAN